MTADGKIRCACGRVIAAGVSQCWNCHLDEMSGRGLPRQRALTDDEQAALDRKLDDLDADA